MCARTDHRLVIISGIKESTRLVHKLQSELKKFDDAKKDVHGDSDPLEPDWDVTRNDSQNNSTVFVAHLVFSIKHAEERPAELWKHLIKHLKDSN